MKFSKIILSAAVAFTQIASADITATGTVSKVKSFSASADPAISENWSWFQLSGMTSTSGCPSGDEGVGSLSYIALTEADHYLESIILSAYLGAQNIEVVVDEVGLYNGKCRIKSLALAPEIVVVAAPVYNSLDPNNKSADITLTNDNLTASPTTIRYDKYSSVKASATLSPGKKYYWEVAITMSSSGNDYPHPGIVAGMDADSYIGGHTSDGYAIHITGTGKSYHLGLWTEPFILFGNNDRIMFAFDPDAGKLWFGKNGVWQGNPAGNTGARFSSITGVYSPGITVRGDMSATMHFDPASFQYTPPAGFVPSTIN